MQMQLMGKPTDVKGSRADIRSREWHVAEGQKHHSDLPCWPFSRAQPTCLAKPARLRLGDLNAEAFQYFSILVME
jgi:hypothetical protein